VDAMNVHPFEFLTGEFLHLGAIMAIPSHLVAVWVFLVIGGIGASLNHTRFDVRLLNGLYEVRAHDVHHRIPQSNYGQYIMLWDKLWGSFRPYQGKQALNADGRDDDEHEK
jgi:sterol desaturase/sphingolipid hydroxylase (fatty acid hydroxylase superfamily)